MYFICILIQNLQTYQYIVTYILGTQMGFRRKLIDFCESVCCASTNFTTGRTMDTLIAHFDLDL